MVAKFFFGLALLISFVFLGCASFESRFTSQTGCPEEDILVIKRSNNLFGNQSYTIACHGKKYYCTEDFIEKQHSNLKCSAERRRRHPSSEESDRSGDEDSFAEPLKDAELPPAKRLTPYYLETEQRRWYRY